MDTVAARVRLAASEVLDATREGRRRLSADDAGARHSLTLPQRKAVGKLVGQAMQQGADLPEAARWHARAAVVADYGADPAAADSADRQMLSADESLVLKVTCDAALSGGFPLDVGMLTTLMRQMVIAEDRIDPHTGDQFLVSEAYVYRWMKKHEVKGHKTSVLDIQRAEKATVALRNTWFGLVRSYVQSLYSEGKIPWATFEEIPADCKFNMDEEAANGAKGRAKIEYCETATVYGLVI